MNLADAPVEVPLPSFVQIEPVGQCNLSCRMCPVTFREDGGKGKPPAFMSFDAFKRVLDQFPAMSELHLQGLGEPLLHPRFFDLVAYAAGRGIEVSTNTNMTAMSERRAEACVESGLARMHVSLDAADKATYEYIRVGARYDRVLRNLRHVVEAKARLGAARPEIHLVAVLMRRSLEQIPGLVKLASEFGAAGLSVQHLCHDFTESTLPGQYKPMRAFIDAETLSGEQPERVHRVFAEARALAQALKVSLRLPRIRGEGGESSAEAHRPSRLRCDWPWRGAYVSFSGLAMPCCMVATPDRVNFGNMSRDGVARVWNSDGYQRFRERLASDDPPEICRGCAVYNGTF